jgi:uncharacterized protein YbbK (DUF523 family)
MIIVSACLAGVNTRYDGKNKLIEAVQKLVGQKKAIPLCPEALGGLGVPRKPAEIAGGTGEDVLDGKAIVKDEDGNDVTEEFIFGAKIIVKTVKRMNAAAVILKTKSGSCGYGKIYDGTFSGKLRDGNGVLTAMLLREGIKIYTEENFEELIKDF